MARPSKFQQLLVQPKAAADVASKIKLSSGHTAKALQVVDSADSELFSVSAAGLLAFAAGQGFTASAIARTATADGLTTGTIADGPMLQFITVTSASANNIIVLPSPTPGSIVILHVAATGYELRTSAPATIGINGGTGASAESAIGANVTAVLICATATSWKGFQMAGDGTLTLVEVAA